MSDSTTPEVPATTAPETTPRTRGYFNQGQLDDIDLASAVLTAARSHPAEMTGQDITEAYLAGADASLAEGRTRAAESGQQSGESKQTTAAAVQAGRDLLAGLRKIQSAAKQKHQMLAADGDPATNFPLDGYLLGTRLHANRPMLLQSAITLIKRATEDSLPGFKTPEKIAAIQVLLTSYEQQEGGQTDSGMAKELARLGRDELIDLINIQRAATQHAADAIWPFNNPSNRPIRKTFALPLARPMGF